jgi:hypothetical protein
MLTVSRHVMSVLLICHCSSDALGDLGMFVNPMAVLLKGSTEWLTISCLVTWDNAREVSRIEVTLPVSVERSGGDERAVVSAEVSMEKSREDEDEEGGSR